jgi:predicted RNase H-like nuclease (RuvC/YqgF family)
LAGEHQALDQLIASTQLGHQTSAITERYYASQVARESLRRRQVEGVPLLFPNLGDFVTKSLTKVIAEERLRRNMEDWERDLEQSNRRHQELERLLEDMKRQAGHPEPVIQ